MGVLLLCLVAHVADADTVKCATGEHVRIAAVSGLERDGACNSTPYCATMPFDAARAIAEREMLGRTITFRIVGYNNRRLVGENYAVRCRLTRSGAAVAWPVFEARYGLAPCRG